MASGGGGCKGGGSEGGGSEEVLLPSCTVLAPPAETYCRRPCASRCQPVPSSLRAFGRRLSSSVRAKPEPRCAPSPARPLAGQGAPARARTWGARPLSRWHVGCAPSLARRPARPVWLGLGLGLE
eukprot:scaffold117380_cov48-Phaeocystis_antarctica.AAC.1